MAKPKQPPEQPANVDVEQPPENESADKLVLNPLQRGLIFTVKLYQWGISPFLGNNCRFHPTCSQYCIEAMERHGVLKGFYLGVRRVLRCHPYCQGGYDPVPDRRHHHHKNQE